MAREVPNDPVFPAKFLRSMPDLDYFFDQKSFNGMLQGSLTEGEGSVQLTSLYELVYMSSFYIKNNVNVFLTKQATLMRRSAALSLLLVLTSLYELLL